MLPVRMRSRSSPIAIASATQTCSANFDKRGNGAVDVAAIDGVADFHERQQHGEQDRGRLHHAQRRVVGAAAQEDSSPTQNDSAGNAVALEQPVEDRRGADGIAAMRGS